MKTEDRSAVSIFRGGVVISEDAALKHRLRAALFGICEAFGWLAISIWTINFVPSPQVRVALSILF
jgi:hypothetical protein